MIFERQTHDKGIQVRFEDGDLWLTQKSIGELFDTTRYNITMHINEIYKNFELDEKSTSKDFLLVQKEGNREVSRDVEYYNLDMIISLGYRIKSSIATQFRIWATERLKEYIIKGFTMDDERLKQNRGGNYWKELLDRIRDIRSSEKVLYRQVLDLYATSRDYDAKAPETIEFFKVVQNKLHYAAHGHTASEVIYERVDSDKPFMGLTTFSGDLPTKSEAKIAKNYLTPEELKILNNLVSGYFDFAEIYAARHEYLYMKDYLKQLDNILSATGEKVLQNAGKIKHSDAMKKVDAEYKKYQQKTITPVEAAYLECLKTIEKSLSKKK